MKTLKIAGTVILSVLLFFSLNILAAGITVERTILNAGFVNSAVQRADLPGILEQVFNEQAADEISSGITDALVSVAASRQTDIKVSAESALNSVYDYIRSKTSQINLAEVLRSSLLADEFLHAFIEELDLVEILRENFELEIGEKVPAQLKNYTAHTLAVEKALQDNELLLKGQLKDAAGNVADYLVGDTGLVQTELNISAVVDSIGEYLMEEFTESPPEYLSDVDEQLVITEFNRLFNELRGNLAENILIDEELLGSDFKLQFDQVVEDGEAGLSQVREFATGFRKSFIISIAAALVCTLLILLLHRSGRRSMLNFGIVFVMCAIVVLPAAIAGRGMIPEQVLTSSQAPAAIENWILGITRAVFMPAIITGIVYLVIGMAAFGAYIFLHRQEQY